MKTAVVFIHGFMGGDSTWTNPTGNSFLELLRTDPTLNGFDFFEFSYFSKLTDFFHSAPYQKIMSAIPFINRLPGITGKVRMNRPIAQLSEELATYMNLTLEKYDEVILIAHSMGGLIAKDHILNFQIGHGPKPVGYISIAVPHKGSLAAQLLGPLNNINGKELKPLSEQCDKLNNEWIEKRDNLPPAIYMVAQHDEVVVKESALPFSVKRKDKFVVNHDHTSICKPVDRADLSYQAVRKFLKDFYDEKIMWILSNESSLLAKPDYDKEIFVLKMIVCDIGKKGIIDAKDCFFNAEIISKVANKTDAMELRALQSKVLSLYQQKFNACNGKKMLSNDIFAEVHSEITAQDSGVLKSTIKNLNFLHKKGFLHQLANNFTDDVVWSDDTDFEKIRSTIK